MNTENNIWQELMLTPKGNRAGFLYDVITRRRLDQQTINELIDTVWTTQEFPHQWRDEWAEIWNAYEISEENQQLIAELFKEPRVIYRGGHRQGLSWTLDRNKAVWFAEQRRGSGASEIHERVTTAKEVKMIYLTDRDEQEVVLDNGFWLYDEEI